MLLNQKLLLVPDGVDVLSFIISNGQVELPLKAPHAQLNGSLQADITLRELQDQYLEAHASGAMEQNSLDTVRMHLRHIIKTLGVNLTLAETAEQLQFVRATARHPFIYPRLRLSIYPIIASPSVGAKRVCGFVSTD